MSTSIFFNGRVTRVPGSYLEVDASGLEQVGLGALGIVAVLGTAEGGKPASVMTKPSDFLRYNKPQKMIAAFKSGQLREVANPLFAPSKDGDILGGAASVVAMKTNPSTQSTGALQASAVDQIDLTSLDYGAFTAQINVEVASGTNQGKALTIRFEDQLETVDDLGGDALFTLQYSGGTNGYNTALAGVNAAGDIIVTATRTGAGTSTDITLAHAGGAAQIVSTNAGDTTQTVTIFGLKSAVATKVAFTLNGTTAVAIGTWDASGILGVIVSAAHAGTINVQTTAGPATVISLATGTLTKGVLVCDYAHVDRTTFAAVLDGSGTGPLLAFGRNAANGAVNESLALTGAVAVTSAGTTYARIDTLVTSLISNARTLTVTVRAARSLAAVQTTVKKAADLFNAKSEVIAGPLTRGFIFTITTGATTFLTSNLDIVSSVDVKDPATGSFTADLYAIIAWINQNSVLVSAAQSTGATGVPDNTSSPLFLTGGDEGVATFTDYQNALNLLKRTRVNTIVDLSGDPAVAAAIDAHCAYMCGIGRSERDGKVGLLNGAMTGLPTKTEIKAQIVDLNSRHIQAVAQSIKIFNTSGEKQVFLPPFYAAVMAGMESGGPVGTSTTHKYLNVLEIDQHSSWNPTDDADEMIEAGLCFAEELDGVGRRVVRGITTHLTTDNIAFTEASVNQAVNFSTFNFRGAMEFAIGKSGSVGTIGVVKGLAVGTLNLLVSSGAITTWRALDLELLVDVLDVSVEMAPIIPINFARTTVHLVTLAQSAAQAAA